MHHVGSEAAPSPPPTDPAYRDLNLAQTAALMSYLAFRAADSPSPPQASRRATHAQVYAASQALLDVARKAEFPKTKREPVSRELPAFFQRVGLTRRESELLGGPIRRATAKIGPVVPR